MSAQGSLKMIDPVRYKIIDKWPAVRENEFIERNAISSSASRRISFNPYPSLIANYKIPAITTFLTITSLPFFKAR